MFILHTQSRSLKSLSSVICPRCQKVLLRLVLSYIIVLYAFGRIVYSKKIIIPCISAIYLLTRTIHVVLSLLVISPTS
uniref:Uncharacterized protein n=1 Tax=Arundo donax TaxID=35708 RepID=A0A0A8XZW4_ARUDO